MESWGVRAWEVGGESSGWEVMGGESSGGRYGFMGKVGKFEGVGVESAWVWARKVRGMF